MKIDANQWAAYTKSARFPITDRCNVELLIAAAGPILITGITDDGDKIPIRAGTDFLHFKSQLHNFSNLQVDAKTFGVTAKLNGVQHDEPRDNEPAPRPKEPNNILQKLREQARRDMQISREHFDNDTQYPGHESDDERFEEEIIAEQTGTPDTGDDLGVTDDADTDGDATKSGDATTTEESPKGADPNPEGTE